MQTFEFKVKIEAETKEKAKKILTALFDIKKSVSDSDLVFFANAIKNNPKLVKKAKMFM